MGYSQSHWYSHWNSCVRDYSDWSYAYGYTSSYKVVGDVMSVLKQYHRAIEEESRRLNREKVKFGFQWDSIMDYRKLEEHNQICREIVKAVNKERKEVN